MPTSNPQTTATALRAKAAAQPNAIDLLESDHKEVKSLFLMYDKLVRSSAGRDERQDLAQRICAALKLHAQIEEEIFYPAAREVLAEQDLVDEASVEHASAKDLIAQIESMDPHEDLYDAKVKVLAEYIAHHVKEEQNGLFPKIRRRMDIKEVGARLKARKDELASEQREAH